MNIIKMFDWTKAIGKILEIVNVNIAISILAGELFLRRKKVVKVTQIIVQKWTSFLKIIL